MSNPLDRQQSLRKNVKTAMDRLTEVEESVAALQKDLQGLLVGLNKALNPILSLDLPQKTAATEEILEALVLMLGPEAVAQALTQNRERKAEESAKASKEALQKALAEGTLVALDKIEDPCIVEGVEYDKENAVIHPGYALFSSSNAKPEYKEKLLGQAVGYELETEKGKFVVTGIYKTVEKPAEAAPETAPEAPSLSVVPDAPAAPAAETPTIESAPTIPTEPATAPDSGNAPTSEAPAEPQQG